MGKSMGRKNACSVSIIGGADGPTSVFVAGRTGKRPLKERIRRYRYQCRRKRVAARIKPGTHTPEEVVSYIKDTYGAVEISRQQTRYKEQKSALRESLIYEKKPELLGDMKDIPRPDVYNEETIKELHRRIQLRSEWIANIPEEQMPMDFHVYEIRTKDGSLELAVDFMWDALFGSYSGSKKEMKKLNRIFRDIHLYYGFTEEDRRNNTKRYSELLTVLST